MLRFLIENKLTTKPLDDLLSFFCNNEYDNIDLVKNLVEIYNMDIDIKDQYGWNPLLIACSWGNFEIAKYLIKKGADINVKNDYNENLICLINEHIWGLSSNRHVNILKYLIYDCDIDMEDIDSETLCYYVLNDTVITTEWGDRFVSAKTYIELEKKYNQLLKENISLKYQPGNSGYIKSLNDYKKLIK